MTFLAVRYLRYLRRSTSQLAGQNTDSNDGSRCCQSWAVAVYATARGAVLCKAHVSNPAREQK